MAQEAFEDRSQASSSPKVTVEPDNSESLLANNESNSYKESISAESSSDTENNILVIYCTEHNGSDVMCNGGCLVQEIKSFVTVIYKLSESKKL